MLLRWASALVGIPVFIGLCLWGVVPFTIGITLLAAIGLFEMVNTYRAQGLRPNLLLAAVGLLLPARPLFHFEDNSPLMISPTVLAAVLLAVFLALTYEVARAGRTGEMTVARNIGYGLLCGLYISLFAGLTYLRAYGEGTTHILAFHHLPLDVGACVVLLTVFCVWATDSFAFFVGRAFGSSKLAPKLSPGKTIEGALGGLLASVIVGVVFGYFMLDHGPPLFALGIRIGAIAGVFGQVGDLFESALKREAGVKDFGGIMPGHGGVLDRFDSLLFVCPLVWLMLWWTHGL